MGVLHLGDFPRHMDYKGWATVYVVGPEQGQPFQIGYTTQPDNRIYAIADNPHDKIVLHHNVWVADYRVASRLKKACHALLDKANKRIDGGDWFDIPVEWARKVIICAADKEHIPLHSNADITEIAERRRRAKERRFDFMPPSILRE
jgi:hypothetical protein